MKYIILLILFSFSSFSYSTPNMNQTALCKSNNLELGKTYNIQGLELSVTKLGTARKNKSKSESKMTTFIFTVLGGVIIFSFGQILLKLIIEPAQELKKTIAKVSNTLLLYQDKITNKTCNDEISSKISSISAELLSQSSAILGYKIARVLFSLPSIFNITNASKELNYISYGLNEVQVEADESLQLSLIEINKSLWEIGSLLNINTTYEQR